MSIRAELRHYSYGKHITGGDGGVIYEHYLNFYVTADPNPDTIKYTQMWIKIYRTHSMLDEVDIIAARDAAIDKFAQHKDKEARKNALLRSYQQVLKNEFTESDKVPERVPETL